MDDQDCQYLYMSKGCKIGRDPGMPESCWGGYLPGDEPGPRCSETDDICNGIDIDIKECPKWELINDFCCSLQETDECEHECWEIYYNEEDDIAFCVHDKEIIDVFEKKNGIVILDI